MSWNALKKVTIATDAIQIFPAIRFLFIKSDSLVRLEENTVARMYNIVAVRLTIQDSDPEACYEIDQDTVIKISKEFLK